MTKDLLLSQIGGLLVFTVMKAQMLTHAIVLGLLGLPLATPSSGYATPSSGEKTSLFSMIELASKNHPEIAALRARVDAAQARRQAAPSIPPPSLSLGVMGEQGPFNSNGRMENSIEVRQTLPFPTKLTAESRTRHYEEQATEEELQARLRSLRAEVRVAYFDLYRARELQGILHERKSILEAHVRRIRSTSLSDRMLQVHLLRFESEVELSQNELEKAQQESQVAQGALNVLVGQDPHTTLPVLEEPPLPGIPNVALDSSVEGHPQIQALKSTAQAAEAASDRARAEWLPDFMLKYRYNRRFDGVTPSNSEVMVGVELPFLFFWQPNGRAAEASARVAETRAQVVKSRNDLKFEQLKARTSAQSLYERILAYQKRILPKAEKRMKIAHSTAPTDMESLNEHRESTESLLDLRMASLSLRADYEKAIATLENLTVQNPGKESQP